MSTDPAEVARDDIIAAARLAFIANRQFIAAAKPGTAAAQASAAYDAEVATKRQINGILRLLIGPLDGTD